MLSYIFFTETMKTTSKRKLHQEEETYRNTYEDTKRIILEQDKLQLEIKMLQNRNEMLQKQMRNLDIEFKLAELKTCTSV